MTVERIRGKVLLAEDDDRMREAIVSGPVAGRAGECLLLCETRGGAPLN